MLAIAEAQRPAPSEPTPATMPLEPHWAFPCLGFFDHQALCRLSAASRAWAERAAGDGAALWLALLQARWPLGARALLGDGLVGGNPRAKPPAAATRDGSDTTAAGGSSSSSSITGGSTSTSTSTSNNNVERAARQWFVRRHLAEQHALRAATVDAPPTNVDAELLKYRVLVEIIKASTGEAVFAGLLPLQRDPRHGQPKALALCPPGSVHVPPQTSPFDLRVSATVVRLCDANVMALCVRAGVSDVDGENITLGKTNQGSLVPRHLRPVLPLLDLSPLLSLAAPSYRDAPHRPSGHDYPFGAVVDYGYLTGFAGLLLGYVEPFEDDSRSMPLPQWLYMWCHAGDAAWH